MRRFFSPELTLKSTSVELTGTEYRHIKRVLRLKTNTEVELFNGRGLTCTGRLLLNTELEKSFAVVEITGFLEPNINESPVEVVLVQGLVKGAKPEFIIQKATELGAVEVRFYAAERSVPDVKDKRAETKLARWSRVAVEAAKQCRRSVVPRVSLYSTLKEAIGPLGTDCPDSRPPVKGLLFTLAEVDTTPKSINQTEQLEFSAEPENQVKEVLAGLKGVKRVFVVIGPEGGIDARETETALGAGLIPVSLGHRVLRTETAALTVLSIIQYELGDLG